jgi:hypothetical protein
MELTRTEYHKKGDPTHDGWGGSDCLPLSFILCHVATVAAAARDVAHEFKNALCVCSLLRTRLDLLPLAPAREEDEEAGVGQRELGIVMRAATYTVPLMMKTTATAIRAKTWGRTPALATAVWVGCAGFWRRTTVGPLYRIIAVMRSSRSG